MEILSIEVNPIRIPDTTVVVPLANVTYFKDVHPVKMPSRVYCEKPALASVFGNCTDSSDVQFSNAPTAISSNFEESVSDDKFEHPLNASDPMVLTLSGITILLIFLQSSNAALEMLAQFDESTTSVRLVHPAKACAPMLATVSGIEMLTSEEHPTNSPAGMDVAPLAMVALA